MTRKIMFVAAVLAILLPLSVFAGGTQPTEGAAAGSDEPQYGGTLTMSGGANEPPSPSISDAIHYSLHWLEPMQERPIHGTVENDLVGEIADQTFAFHSRTSPLNWIQYLDAGSFDQVRDGLPGRAVGMIEDVNAV